jgi:hypothetical protein
MICPLLASGRANVFIDTGCRGADCAWFDAANDRCAIASLSKSLDPTWTACVDDGLPCNTTCPACGEEAALITRRVTEDGCKIINICRTCSHQWVVPALTAPQEV